jgi:hypothetical protein
MLFPLAIIFSLGPFFGPYITLRISQQVTIFLSTSHGELICPQLAWDHRCDSFLVEVNLDALPYNAPVDAEPRATFFFWQNGVRTKLYDYNLINSQEDANVWDLQFGTIEPGAIVPAQWFPSIQDMSIDVSNGTFSASCVTGPDMPMNATTPCIYGSFSTSVITTNDTRANNVTHLKAEDEIWYSLNNEDAPDYILRDVEPDLTLGNIALRTAVTEPGHPGTCT